MDAEMFTTGGFVNPLKYLTPLTVDSAKLPEHQMIAVIKLSHAVKWCAKIMLVMLIIALVVEFTVAIPIVVTAWKKMVKGDKFTQKEGLQYLGASADIIRGDLEQNQDSLAEKALRQQNAITDMAAPVKARFRERASDRELTPEEKLTLQQQGH
jgi:hypothetical protein